MRSTRIISVSVSTSVSHTSHRGLHGGLHHAHQQLQALGVLRQPGGEGSQGVGMAAQVLKGNTLSEVCLQGQRKQEVRLAEQMNDLRPFACHETVSCTAAAVVSL